MTKQKTIKEKLNGEPTPKTIVELIGVMTLSEIQFLDKLFQSPESTAFASNQREGPVAGSLHQKRVIRPAGRVGTHIRWTPVENLFHIEARNLIREIIGRRAFYEQ